MAVSCELPRVLLQRDLVGLGFGSTEPFQTSSAIQYRGLGSERETFGKRLEALAFVAFVLRYFNEGRHESLKGGSDTLCPTPKDRFNFFSLKMLLSH